MVWASYLRRQALRELADDQFVAARKHLEQALLLNPKDGESAWLLARTLRRSGEPATAGWLEKAQALGVRSAQIELEQLLQRAQSGAVAAVESRLQQYLTTGTPDEPWILEAFTLGYLQGQFLDPAHRYAALWVQRHSDMWQAHYWQARVLDQGLQFDLAADAYRRVLERKADHVGARLRLGELLVRANRHAEALPHFEALLESEPDHPSALLGAASCLRALDDPAAAERLLDRLLALRPDHARGWLLRGQLQLDRDEPTAALDSLLQAVQAAPFDPQINHVLATTLRLLRRDAEAAEYERKQQQIEADWRRLEELTKELIAEPNDPNRRYEAGMICLRLGQDQRGVHWLLSALLLDPHHQPTRKALADSLPKLGDPELTARYRRVLERDKPVP